MLRCYGLSSRIRKRLLPHGWRNLDLSSFGPPSPQSSCSSWLVVRSAAHPSSEQQLQPELDLPRGVYRATDPSRSTQNGSAGTEDSVARQTKVGVIQEIEELGPKIQSYLLTYWNYFRQGEVHSRKAGRSQSVPAQIPIEAGWGKRKGTGIIIFVRPP